MIFVQIFIPYKQIWSDTHYADNIQNAHDIITNTYNVMSIKDKIYRISYKNKIYLFRIFDDELQICVSYESPWKLNLLKPIK